MNAMPFGEVFARTVDLATGEVIQQAGPVKNLFLNQGADILGQLLAGTGTPPNMAYLEFQNGGTPPVITPAVDEGRSYYEGLESTGPSNDRDYLRVPLSISPTVEASGTGFVSNKVTFGIISSGVLGAVGLEFSATAGSKIYGMALVSAPDAADRTQDLVYARAYFTTPFEKSPTAQFQARWPYRF